MQNGTRFIALALLVLATFANLGAAATVSAPASNVAMSQALNDAQFLASMHENSQVMRVSGVSMLPYFDSASLIVVKPISSEKLRQGMVVVYRNRFGEVVAHKLVARSSEGWVAKGFNNSDTDSTQVDASNLLGVVYATVHTSGFENSCESLPVALAAPAK